MIDNETDRFSIRKDFRYVHEPITGQLTDTWVVGRHRLARELADKIMMSRGGAILISGLRGVGKTTYVQLAIQLIRSARQSYQHYSDVELVDVWISLARPLEPLQLLHHLIRHLYLRLNDLKLIGRLDKELQADLKKAFMRTSFEISARSVRTEESGRTGEAGFGKAPWLGIEFLGKMSSSYKRSRSDEELLKYLPYDEKAAEFDLLSFSNRLSKQFLRHRFPTFPFRKRHASQIKVVFVFDELDKHDLSNEDGQSPLDPILHSLKTIFTSSGFSYVFIGGKETDARMHNDAARGDSIYESIFSHDLYLPCLWDEQSDIFNLCIASDSESPFLSRDTLLGYLRYKSRGVPRRAWRELNKHVVWEHRLPVLHLDYKRRRYMEVFAKAQNTIQYDELFGQAHGIHDLATLDRYRLCLYYTMDWVFSQAERSFSADHLAAAVRALNLGATTELGFSDHIAKRAIMLLLRRAFIQRSDREQRLVANEAVSYQLSPWVHLAFQGVPEKEATSGKTGAREYIGVYRIVRKIAEGGFSDVYEVCDPQGRTLAAKTLRALSLSMSAVPRDMFDQEIANMRRLQHPGLLRLHDFGEDQGQPYLIMDLLEGFSLRDVLDSVKTLTQLQACSIALELSRICGYIHSQRLIRLDIKPSNIYLGKDNDVKVIDLGIAVPVRDGRASNSTLVVGTPGYIAPEQLTSDSFDERADIFALGVVLFEMLTGYKPISPTPSKTSRDAEVDPGHFSTFVDVPDALEQVLQIALATNPGDRFQSMAEFGRAIQAMSDPDAASVINALMAQITHRSTSDSTEDTAIGPRREPSAAELEHKASASIDSSESYENAVRLLYSRNVSDQDHAFSQLTKLEGDSQKHLLFDLARKLCMWSNSSLTGSPTKFALVPGSPITMGRGASAVELPLDDLGVSRQHLAFFLVGDKVEVEDLSTANGTLLNGMQISRTSRALLSDNDRLQVGDCDIHVHITYAAQ